MSRVCPMVCVSARLSPLLCVFHLLRFEVMNILLVWAGVRTKLASRRIVSDTLSGAERDWLAPVRVSSGRVLCERS